MNEALGYFATAHKSGRQLMNRRASCGGYLNVRRRGTQHQVEEWIKYYNKEVEAGRMCPVRGQKIIAHFERMLD